MNNKIQHKSKYDVNKTWKRASYVNKVNQVQTITSIKDVLPTNVSYNKQSSKKEIIDPDYIPIWKRKRNKTFILNEYIIITVITKDCYEHFSNLLDFIKIQYPYILIENNCDYSIKIKNLHINYTLTIVYQPMKWFMNTNIENLHKVFNISYSSKNYHDTYNTVINFLQNNL